MAERNEGFLFVLALRDGIKYLLNACSEVSALACKVVAQHLAVVYRNGALEEYPFIRTVVFKLNLCGNYRSLVSLIVVYNEKVSVRKVAIAVNFDTERSCAV